MNLSLEIQELLWDSLILGGGGIGGLVSIILPPILYFRLTRKYDAMFPNYMDLSSGVSIQADIARTGRYMRCVLCKNFSQRNELVRNVTGGYDFRGNAPLLDIILCYMMCFFGLIFIVSVFTFFILTKIFGIDL